MIFAAAQAHDDCLWEIGDALLVECGPPREDSGEDGSYRMLEEAAEELEGLGIEGYSVGRLYNLRKVAHTFPPPTRHRGLSWKAHRDAKSPELLQAILLEIGLKAKGK